MELLVSEQFGHIGWKDRYEDTERKNLQLLGMPHSRGLCKGLHRILANL